MEPTRHPFRKFVFAASGRVTTEDGSEFVSLVSPKHGRSYRLKPGEFELARLFDGARDAEAVRSAARSLLGESPGPAELEQFANELSVAGLLEAGAREPLPVPPQSDEEIQAAGWSASADDTPPPPSILSGSLSGPGRSGSLTGLWGVFRGQAEPIRVPLSLKGWTWLGWLASLPVANVILLWVLLTCAVGGFYGLLINHGYVAADLTRLLGNLLVLALVVVPGTLLANFIGQLARAATVSRVAGVQPRFGLIFGFGFIPYFRADTSGSAETVDRSDRLRIVGAAPLAQALLFVLGILIWLAFRRTGSWLPVVALGESLVALVALVLALNPLLRRDGYYLLANALNAPDLREQSIIALFGWQRPWHESRPLPPWMLRLYGIVSLAYVIWVSVFIVEFPGRWFAGAWGGTGVAVFLALTAYVVYVQVRRVSSPRSRVGDIVLAPPSQVHYAIAAALAVVALLPFPFQPSGEFVVLPMMRANINAQIDGPITEVLVKEGDRVKQGQPVARIGDDAQKTAVAAGEAAVAHLEAQLALAKGGHKPQEIDLAKQQVEVAAKRYEFSKLMADRIAHAHDRKAVSDQEYDHAQQIAAVDKEELLTAKRNLSLVSSPAQSEQLTAIEADVKKAKAQLLFDRHQLELATMRSPIDGQIVSGTLQFAVGDYMHRGDLLAHVEQTRQLQIAIGLPEAQVSDVKLGAQAYAKCWAYPGRSFPGKVTQIAPSVETIENGKVVRVVMTMDNSAGLLKPGMTGYAKIDAGTFPVIVVFTRALYRFFFVEVWSWLP